MEKICKSKFIKFLIGKGNKLQEFSICQPFSIATYLLKYRHASTIRDQSGKFGVASVGPQSERLWHARLRKFVRHHWINMLLAE